MSHPDAPITREGILKAAFEERVRMSVEALDAITAAATAGVRPAAHAEFIQGRVDNAVKIYCAQLTVDSLEEIVSSLDVYVGEGISEAIREAAEAALERAS